MPEMDKVWISEALSTELAKWQPTISTASVMREIPRSLKNEPVRTALDPSLLKWKVEAEPTLDDAKCEPITLMEVEETFTAPTI